MRNTFGGSPPAATVQFGDEEKRHACDWTFYGYAYQFADWKVLAYARREAGAKEQIRLTTLLGVFVGEAYASSVEIYGNDVVTHLHGSGELRYEGPAS